MEQLILSNFKGYAAPTTIGFSDITLNVGMNSVGKSTVVQAILLLRQLFDIREQYKGTTREHFHILLNGPYDLQLGDYEHIVPNGTEEFSFTVGKQTFVLKKDIDKYSLLYTLKDEKSTIFPNTPLFSEDFYYINAERLGPRNCQDIASIDNSFCGYHGEHTFEIINRYCDPQLKYRVSEKRLREGETSPLIQKQIEAWMDYIVPGVIFNVNEDIVSRTAKLQIRQTTLDTDWSSPHNYGFGISYLLPIIATGLLAKENSVFIVENPEAHLHPNGQSRIGRFLAQVAFSGVQVIVETHSEHVVNGARLHALKNRVSPDKIRINNFSIADGAPNVERIPMSSNMDILKWPDGFLDQEEKDLAELRHLRRK